MLTTPYPPGLTWLLSFSLFLNIDKGGVLGLSTEVLEVGLELCFRWSCAQCQFSRTMDHPISSYHSVTHLQANISPLYLVP